MAKIIFSEVRTKTILYDSVVKLLIEAGHEVVWVVQNHLFTPVNGARKYVLPYPSKRDIVAAQECEPPFFEYIRATDRMVQYFGNDGSYYGYYYQLIKDIFEKEMPDMVIGEVGNFHTHMLCFLCREYEKPFYDLMTSRYPTGRFSFHLYDKYHPIVLNDSSGLNIEDTELEKLRQLITNRKMVPEYMNILKRNMLWEKVKYLPYRIQLFTEYIKGEKFCTHNPLMYFNRRYKIYSKYRSLVRISNKLDFIRNTGKKVLLYPMQMQPELNLDVWGAKHRNQVKLIESIGESLPVDWCLVVKLNPKAREDLNNDLIDVIKQHDNIFVLNPIVAMKDIDNMSDCAITVTGTIALERIMREEPVIVLGDSFLVKEGFVPGGIEIRNLREYLESFNREAHIRLQVDGDTMLRELIQRSVPGIISEPLKNPRVMSDTNVKNIFTGISRVVNKLTYSK